jgi:acetyl-CoA synthetase
MRFGASFVHKYDLSSLRVLGSVGEPINPAAWEWYNEHVGQGRCAIVDTYWQTETGGIVVTPLPGATAVKPGSAVQVRVSGEHVYCVNNLCLTALLWN